MLALQESFRDHGNTISRVQRMNIGFTRMGYKTDKYLLVFFGKIDEVRNLAEKEPWVIPYLPSKISNFAKNDLTILITSNPRLDAIIAADAVDPVIFERWGSTFVPASMI
jgi:hypothetical protein